MAIRKVARLGHPVLRKKGREVTLAEIRSPDFVRLLQDMRETMVEYGGIGLAAPQIHESIQVALVGLGDEGKEIEPEVYINPTITVLDAEEQGFWEGCLSIPDLRGLVFRPRKIRVDFLDQTGTKSTVEAEGFRATVLQHELDHLAGIVYLDRVQDTTKIAFVEEYERYLTPHPDSEIGELAD